MPTRADKPVPLRLDAATLSLADRVRATIARRTRAAGGAPLSRHAVLVLAVREGLAVLAERGPRGLKGS